jgi:hypothetical protein
MTGVRGYPSSIARAAAEGIAPIPIGRVIEIATTLDIQDIVPAAPNVWNLDMTPDTVNITFYEGDDIFIDLCVFDPNGNPVLLGDSVVKAEIRTSATTTTSAIAAFTGVCDGSVIHLHLSSTVNVNMPVTAVWDCQITYTDADDNSYIFTMCHGSVTIVQEVTRP